MGGTAIADAGRDRLETLDLLRGLAALAILARHFPWPEYDVLLLPRSYLAVDLFFTLSGFVIAYSYQHRLEGGLPRRSVVVVSQISSVEKARLGERIGTLSEQRVDQVLAGLRFLQRSFFR